MLKFRKPLFQECKCFPSFHTTNDPEVGNYSLCAPGPELTCVNELMNRLGQIDHVDYQGKSVKCRSNCEDQINSLFVTSSAYPNRGVFTMRYQQFNLKKNIPTFWYTKQFVKKLWFCSNAQNKFVKVFCLVFAEKNFVW